MYDLLKNWKIAQEGGAVLPCPRCGRMKMNSDLHKNALSRIYDIYICDRCGTSEAIDDYFNKGRNWINEGETPEDWWISTNILNKPKYTKSKDGVYKIKVNCDIVLREEDIDDIMSSALDYISYWCGKCEVVGKYLGEYASDQISRGGTLILYDAEDYTKYELTLEKFLKGFSLACDQYGDRFIENGKIDEFSIDGEIADIIVQFALFDDVVFG